MENLKIDISKTFTFVSEEKVNGYKSQVASHLKSLYEKTGRGSDFLGWVNLPSSIDEAQLSDIETTAANLKSKADVVVVIGIGGSYLGARAVIDAMSNSFDHLITERKNPVVIYAGQNIGEDYTAELLELLKDKSFALVVISKSGTTTEPALAFRLLKDLLESKYSAEEAKDRIVAITDAKKGALRTLADQKGYKTYVIPDDVGGRYSVLTPVGLLPIAVAGIDIRALVKGAKDMEEITAKEGENSAAATYAAVRNELYKNGKATEILVNYQPKLHFVAEWWKQLYGESEGKENKGIFPAAVDFSTDLHSMGQWIQEGVRNIFETIITVSKANKTVIVPTDEADLDGLNFLAGKRVDDVNKMAELGTLLAHVDGGVPNIKVEIPVLNEYYLGQLLYFFEIACGISGYILDINPFDQPGVEAYKKNMFALLEKPGFEAETAAIKAKL
ncbi:glucose-6-phosphate isomerase [Saccharicrinis fermentans]|uniref:Glucose-6-phosphate isomerase n=1 Tax=Saccharicrinis fermentans DSM 9555 = JCM 21142 TaxID=869213 RepID=W7XV01_9BACT|nr:glucose-6-phosphate isomerase [Saccharicrinis fermentans]GAF01890.1 glucose-6-phosphate isomerase [Saccharicrinis fermentans DSM 9555 = JCM 21142]